MTWVTITWEIVLMQNVHSWFEPLLLLVRLFSLLGMILTSLDHTYITQLPSGGLDWVDVVLSVSQTEKPVWFFSEPARSFISSLLQHASRL